MLRNEDVRGFWLIRPDGTKSPLWDYFRGLLKGAPTLDGGTREK